MYIEINGKKKELGELKFIDYYFLKGYHAEYQKGVLYANYEKSLAPLFNEDGDLIRIPALAGKHKQDVDHSDVEEKIKSGKFSIPAAPYIKKWNSELDKQYMGGMASPDNVSAPNANERNVQSFEEFQNV